MARYGKLPVKLPEGVTFESKEDVVAIKGAKGEVSKIIPRDLKIKKQDDELLVETRGASKTARVLQGTFRSHLQNMIKGVVEGWVKVLEFSGPGFKAEVKGKDIELVTGFSHPVIITPLDGVSFRVEKNQIFVEGADKENVGQTAANIRAVRKPDPYKAIGIKYQDEEIIRKAGKQATSGAE